MRFRPLPLALLALSLAAAARSLADEPPAAAPMVPVAPKTDTPLVLTTFEPLRTLAARLAADDAKVESALPPGEDAAHWRPDREALRRLHAADLLVLNGAQFEVFARTANLPLAKTVDASRAFQSEFIVRERVTHRHGPEGDHVHEGVDGHVWLDPVLYGKQAEAVATGLKRLLPHRSEAIDERLRSLLEELEELEAAWRSLPPQKEGETFVAAHPAYDYLARRLGWRVLNLDLDPQTVPEEPALQALKERAATTKARFLLWEEAPAPEVEKAIETATGWQGIVLSPGEALDENDREAGKDYLKVQRENVDRLRVALERNEG